MSAREAGDGRWAGPQDTFGFALDIGNISRRCSRWCCSRSSGSERRLYTAVCVHVCEWITNHWETDWLREWLTDKMNALRLYDGSISWIMTATNSANCKCSIQFDYDGVEEAEGEGEGEEGLEEQQDVCVRVHCSLDWVPCPGIWVAFECQANSECECECENCINAWHFSTLAIAISI